MQISVRPLWYKVSLLQGQSIHEVSDVSSIKWQVIGNKLGLSYTPNLQSLSSSPPWVEPCCTVREQESDPKVSLLTHLTPPLHGHFKQKRKYKTYWQHLQHILHFFCLKRPYEVPKVRE